MDITYRTVPGTGALHHFRTRGGQQFGVLVHRAGQRSLLIYDFDDPDDADVPVQTIVMEHDEADQIADILHSRPLADRLAHVDAGWSSSPGWHRDRRNPVWCGSQRRPNLTERNVGRRPLGGAARSAGSGAV